MKVYLRKKGWELERCIPIDTVNLNYHKRMACPIHKGKDSNLWVDVDKGVFTCHSHCGGGVVISEGEYEKQRQRIRGRESKDDGEVMDRWIKDISTDDILDDDVDDYSFISEGVREHVYTDENGNPLHKKWVRTKLDGEKDIRQYRYEDGKWILGLKGMQKVPYNLPNIVSSDKVIYCEGEKDSDTLLSMGLKWVTTLGSCKDFLQEHHHSYFNNKHVLIIPDEDKVGYSFARRLAEDLVTIGCNVEVCFLNGLQEGEGGDISDWIKQRQSDKGREIFRELFQHVEGYPTDRLNKYEPDIKVNEDDEAEEPFSSYLKPHFGFPLEAMPLITRDVIKEYSEIKHIPMDYLGVSLLGTMAACIGKAYKVNVDCSDWEDNTALWIALIGAPSVTKSPPLKTATTYINKYQAEWHSAYTDDLKQYKDNLKTYEADYKQWVRKKNGNRPSEPEKPVYRQIYTSDTTVEGLVKVMSYNPKGVSLIVDELKGFFGSMNRYNKGDSDLEFYLKAFSGGSHPVTRASGEHVFVKDLYLTIIGTIQPEVFLNYMKKGKIENGMAARFLVCYPNEITQELSVGRTKPIEKLECLYRRLISIEMDSEGTIDKGEPCSKIIGFDDPERHCLFDTINRLIHLKDEFEMDNTMLGIHGKMRGYLVRFSLIVHLIRYWSNEKNIKEYHIDDTSIQMAEKLVYYFMSHASNIWRDSVQNEHRQLTNKLKKLSLKNKTESPFNVRDLAGKKWYGNTEDLKNNLEVLSDRRVIEWLDNQKREFRLT